MKKNKVIWLGIILLVIATLLTGCTQNNENQSTTKEKEAVYKGKTMTIAHPPWTGGSMKNMVIKEVFEERFPGLNVELKQVSMALTCPGLEQGSINLFVEDWLPYYTAVKTYKANEGIINLGPNHNAGISAMEVPDYTAKELGLETIQDIKGKEEALGGKIYCMEPGSENSKQIQQDVEEFNLDLEVVASSTAGLATQFKRSYKNREHVIIAGWHPFWIHYKFNVTDLKDPTGRSVYTYKGHIDTIVNNDFKKEFGEEVYNAVDKINFDNETSELMYYKQQGMSKKEAAHTWIQENQEKIDAWFQEGEDEHEWCKHIGNEDMEGCPDNIAIEVYGQEKLFEE